VQCHRNPLLSLGSAMKRREFITLVGGAWAKVITAVRVASERKARRNSIAHKSPINHYPNCPWVQLHAF